MAELLLWYYYLLSNECQRPDSLLSNNGTKQKRGIFEDHCERRSQHWPQQTLGTQGTSVTFPAALSPVMQDWSKKVRSRRQSLTFGAGKQIAKPRCHEVLAASEVLPREPMPRNIKDKRPPSMRRRQLLSWQSGCCTWNNWSELVWQTDADGTPTPFYTASDVGGNSFRSRASIWLSRLIGHHLLISRMTIFQNVCLRT